MFVHTLRPAKDARSNFLLSAVLTAACKEINERTGCTEFPNSLRSIENITKQVQVIDYPPYDVRVNERVSTNGPAKALRLTQEQIEFTIESETEMRKALFLKEKENQDAGSTEYPKLEEEDADEEPLKWGRKITKSGDRYTGRLVNGLRDGWGTLYMTNGEIYAGEWRYDEMVGESIQFTGDGHFYERELKPEFRSLPLEDPEVAYTKPFYTLINGERRSFDELDGVKNGFYAGKMPSGDTYEGELLLDLKQGHGVMHYADGDMFEGEYANDKRQGYGVFTWKDGSKYSGDYVNSKKHGHGVFTWPDGDKFEGDYFKDQREGPGVYTWADGNKFYGDFKNDKKNGPGVFTWANGDMFEGEYLNDERHGTGVLTTADGVKEERKYENGLLVHAKVL